MRPEAEGASIVMLGSFNPSIFQPRWLGSLNLIRPEEAENAKISTIQAELADFRTEWFQLQVFKDRFFLQSLDPTHYEPLRDLAIGMFTILPHTPINKIGLNRMFHFPIAETEAWHKLGHLLAPKELIWNDIMDQPGMLSLSIQGKRKGSSDGIWNVKTEPSNLIRPGVFVEVNGTFNAPEGSDGVGAQWVPNVLKHHWEEAIKYSEEVAEHILSLVKV